MVVSLKELKKTLMENVDMVIAADSDIDFGGLQSGKTWDSTYLLTAHPVEILNKQETRSGQNYFILSLGSGCPNGSARIESA